jgi:trehalose/maltose transport system substrate-binding protein
MLSTPPTMPDLYQDAELSKENPHLQNIRQAVLQGLVARPSTVAGPKYFDVSEAYTKAVHSVLMHEKNGAAAATELEQELRRIIGSDGRSPSGVPPRTASIPHAPQ